MTVRVAGRSLGASPRLVWRAVVVEATSMSRPLQAWFALLGVLLCVGAAGAIRALFPGDKGIGTTPSFEWGLLIVGYVFFAVTTSGLCLASSLGTVFGIERFRPLEKRHAVLAVLCLVTAFGIIALDLHYPVRLVFGAALNPSPTSPMWWMGVFYGIYLCFLLVEVWSIFWHRPRIHQYACVLSSCMAVLAPSTLGAVFGVIASRPYWASVFTPLLMVATALLSGTALLGIVFYAVDRLHLTGFERAGALALPAIRSLLAFSLVIVSILIARQLFVGLTTADRGLAAATKALLDGPLAVEFVGVRLIGGLLIPLLIVGLPGARTPGALFGAACLAIVGVFVDRLTFVSAGQIAPSTAVSGVVSAPYVAYTPSLVEISILVGAGAFIAMIYTLAERYLDLRESEAHIGIRLPSVSIGRRPRSGRGAGARAGAPESAVGAGAADTAVGAVAPDTAVGARAPDTAAGAGVAVGGEADADTEAASDDAEEEAAAPSDAEAEAAAPAYAEAEAAAPAVAAQPTFDNATERAAPELESPGAAKATARPDPVGLTLDASFDSSSPGDPTSKGDS